QAKQTGDGAFPSPQSVGQAIELAIIAVPPAAIMETVADCARAGVRGLVVLSPGFAEASAEGARVQAALTQAVRQSGMRRVGPNCLGVINTDPAIRLYATFATVSAPTGNVAMLVQSSGLGAVMLDYAEARDLGLASFVSVGNKADVSGNDLLSYWMD